MPSSLRYFLPLLLLVLVAGCDATSEEGVTTFIGTVVDARTDDPIEAATINVVGTGQSATTDPNGFFTLEVLADSTGDMIALQIFARGYNEKTMQVPAVVDREVPMPDIALVSRTDGGEVDPDTDPDGNGGIDGGADEPSGPAASITLLQRSSEAIGVRSAGADETATLTFVVLDAFGNPVDAEHAVDVTFVIANGPGGGEFIAPATKATNASGRVQTTISSGSVSGPVQVLATATNAEGTAIRSLPVVITITGGLPDDAHFSVVPERSNFAGYRRFGKINPVTAFVGDIYGNPVQPGTAVYFTTDGGIIEGSDTTDPLGQAVVRLVSAEPRPSNAPPAECPASDPRGYAFVEARTSDLNQETIRTSATVLFSSDPRVSIATPGLDMGPFDYIVNDEFGHPLQEGSTIKVTADGINVEAIGDVDFALGDFLCPGDGSTAFRFSVVQGDEIGEDDLPLPPSLETISISVQSPNGNIQVTRTSIGGVIRDVVEDDL